MEIIRTNQHYTVEIEISEKEIRTIMEVFDELEIRRNAPAMSGDTMATYRRCIYDKFREIISPKKEEGK